MDSCYCQLSHVCHVDPITVGLWSGQVKVMYCVYQLTDAVLLALAAEHQLKSLTARRCEQFTNTGKWLSLSLCDLE